MDLTPVWWTPDFLTVWLGRKVILFSCLRRITRREFKKDAVALYEDNVDLSLASAAQDLGINRSTLYTWVQKLGTGKRTRMDQQQKQAKQISDAERIRRLEQENRRLREERDILRKAAKYFAEETSW